MVYSPPPWSRSWTPITTSGARPTWRGCRVRRSPVFSGNTGRSAATTQSVADRHGFPHAIVGYADPAAASLEPTLDQMMNHAHLRGIRQQLH